MMSSLTTLAFLNNPIEWIVLGLLGLLIFGKRLPEVGRSVGRGIVEFKKGLSGIDDDVNRAGQNNAPGTQAQQPQNPYAQQQVPPPNPYAQQPQQPPQQIAYQQPPQQPGVYQQPQQGYAQAQPPQQAAPGYPQQPVNPPPQQAGPTHSNQA